MGWCGGSGIYIKVADFEEIIDREYTNEETIIEYFQDVIRTLEDGDWDCKDEALEGLNKHSLAYKALALTMDFNPDCKGKCFEVRCDGKHACGCGCHYE